MATTPNYNWPTPDNTDLVKNGALAIRTLGDAIDTTVDTMIPETIVDAKGDIIAATAADTVTRLAVGANGTVLKANSATATGLEWATDASGMTNPMTTTADVIYSSSGSTPARLGIGTAGQVLTVNSGATAPEWATPAGGGGKVLQVVQATTSTDTVIATTTYTDTSLSASITPTLATSKILILVNQFYEVSRNTDANGGVGIRILKNGSAVFTPSPGLYEFGYSQAVGATKIVTNGVASISYLDSPATTSALTYKTQGAEFTTANSASMVFQQGNAISQITLMEIGI
jgi:hypothetical protein